MNTDNQDPGEIGSGGAGCRPLGGHRLKSGAQLVQVADLVHREPPHAHAAVGLHLHQPFGLQPPKRLAHGRAARAELLGDVVQIDPVTGAQATGQDPITQLTGGA